MILLLVFTLYKFVLKCNDSRIYKYYNMKCIRMFMIFFLYY